MPPWSLTSWQQYAYQQAAAYPDKAALNRALKALSQLPPLVTSSEIKQLKQSIADAGHGRAFILQAGDCAESFQDCRSDIISNKLKIILQMSLILLHGLRKPIIRMGRIAGQYSKPRSSTHETIGGVTLPSYRGDLINTSAFTVSGRTPNPDLLLKGYHYSAATLNFIRALLDGGFAELHHAKQWDLGFVDHSPQADEYHHILKAATTGLDSLASINSPFHQVPFYTSHEALHLHYEAALTRQLRDKQWYALSTHLPWIGVRTGLLDSAHVEFLRGVQNPIGIKVGPHMTPALLIALINKLNPRNEEGRILLITRMGADTILQQLPPLIEAIKASSLPVTWSCDPMHANTTVTQQGVKTRYFDTILHELLQALRIHHEMGSYLGGVHFELTGDNVTECIGGARGLSEHHLDEAYHSLVDPRLNYEQSLEIAIQLSKAFSSGAR